MTQFIEISITLTTRQAEALREALIIAKDQLNVSFRNIQENSRNNGKRPGITANAVKSFYNKLPNNVRNSTVSEIATGLYNEKGLMIRRSTDADEKKNFFKKMEEAGIALPSSRDNLSPIDISNMLSALVSPIDLSRGASGSDVIESTKRFLSLEKTGQYMLFRRSFETEEIAVYCLDMYVKDDCLPMFWHTYISEERKYTSSSGYIFYDGSYLHMIGKRENSPQFIQMILNFNEQSMQDEFYKGTMLSLSVSEGSVPFSTNVCAIKVGKGEEDKLSRLYEVWSNELGREHKTYCSQAYGVYTPDQIRHIFGDIVDSIESTHSIMRMAAE